MSNINCRITNAVKCLPPNNKPNSFEIKKCNVFLSSEINKSEDKSIKSLKKEDAEVNENVQSDVN